MKIEVVNSGAKWEVYLVSDKRDWVCIGKGVSAKKALQEADKAINAVHKQLRSCEEWVFSTLRLRKEPR